MSMFRNFILLLIISVNVYSFELNSIEINCKQESCKNIENSFKSLKRSYNSIEHMKKILKIFIANNGVKDVYYRVVSTGKKNKLILSFSKRIKITEIEDYKFTNEYVIDFPSVLPIKEGDFFDEKSLELTAKILKDVAKDKGFPRSNIQVGHKLVDGSVTITPVVDLGDPIILNDISVYSSSRYLKEILVKNISKFHNGVFDRDSLRREIEEVKKLFIQYGYYLVDISLKTDVLDLKAKAEIQITNSKLFTFYLKGNHFLENELLKKSLRDIFLSYKREFDEPGITQIIRDLYKDYAFLNTTLKVDKAKFRSANGDVNHLYSINIAEGNREKVDKVNFKGNVVFSDEELLKLFYEFSSDQAGSGYFDDDFYQGFVKVVKEKYISKGFVNIIVSKPIYQNFGEDSVLSFKIKEGLQTLVNSVSFEGITKEDTLGILKIFKNLKGSFFNPIEFQNDIERVTSYLKLQGYYFTEIKNLNSLVKYSEDNSLVRIRFNISTGVKLFANEILIIGNDKTRKKLIFREMNFKKGDLLTLDKVERSRTNLLSTGLFSSVQIRPVSEKTSRSDILVFIKEKDFGTIELAPGVRSDLGFKMSVALNYNNIDGMNKKVSFKGTVNRRFELGTLDERRRKESSSLIEYNTTVNYSEDHIFYSDINLNASITKSRRRFFAFDADIQRITLGLSEDITNWLNIGLRYQLESISQFDATNDNEHGHFRIGSFTPSVIFDFRNRRVNTTKGARFSLSYEVANPNYGSQADSELLVDYYKLINRNFFYVPITDKGVFAISTAFGIQENRARSADENTFIPNIKVFRLTGADIVRGYEDNEINRLTTGNDISEVEVNSRAYMVNLKVEPRFFLSDKTMIGVFYDAGRVFVNEFDSSELKSSVGLSFKYLTPVGSLDIDYGIKLLREEGESGRLESPGRLHVSIGFF